MADSKSVSTTSTVGGASKRIGFKAALQMIGCSHVWLRRMIVERHYFTAKKVDGEWSLDASKVAAYAKYFAEREKTKPEWM
jgi:hypothetical protein